MIYARKLSILVELMTDIYNKFSQVLILTHLSIK